MFYLRTREGSQGDGSQSNVVLGPSYRTVKENSPEFYRLARNFGYIGSDGRVDTDKRDIFAFVLCSSADGVESEFPLFSKDRHYVMTSKGDTFEHIMRDIPMGEEYYAKLIEEEYSEPFVSRSTE